MPERAVPSGRAPGRSALQLAVVWSALGLALSALLGMFVLVATLVGLGLAWAYSAPPLRLKAEGWGGPAAVALCYEGLAWLTGAAVMGGETPGGWVIAVALLYSLGAVGIMVLNDFKSVEGDRALGLRSLPVLLGPANACRLACVLMSGAQVAVLAVLATLPLSMGAADAGPKSRIPGARLGAERRPGLVRHLSPQPGPGRHRRRRGSRHLHPVPADDG